jgi:hypothetical protein
LDAATQVQLTPSGDQVVVNIGAGKWAGKAAFMGAGLLVFPPLAIPAAVGAVLQGHLPLEVFDFIERYIVSGGTTAVTVSVASAGSGASAPTPLAATTGPPPPPVEHPPSAEMQVQEAAQPAPASRPTPSPAPVATPAAAPATSVDDEIAKRARLHDMGSTTDEEFAAFRAVPSCTGINRSVLVVELQGRPTTEAYARHAGRNCEKPRSSAPTAGRRKESIRT